MSDIIELTHKSPAELTAEEIERIKNDLVEIWQRLVEMVRPIVEAVMEALRPMIDAAAEIIRKVMEAVWRTYPNKRVLHLAQYSKKARTRKKNIKRIIKWIENGGA